MTKAVGAIAWAGRTARVIAGVHESVGVSRTIHALPFAILGGALAGLPWPGWGDATLIFFCVLFGRATLVGALRVFDAPTDIVDVSPVDPDIPPREPTPRVIWATFAVHNAGVFVFLSWLLNPLTGKLAGAYALLLFIYAGTRRYTGLSHFMLGAGLGASPAAAWVALRGDLTMASIGLAWMCGGISLWVASFDMVYSLQPALRGDGPRRFAPRMQISERGVILLARTCAVAALVGLVAAGFEMGLGPAYPIGVAAIGLVLFMAHRAVALKGFRRTPASFVRLNLLVGPLLLLATLAGR